MILEIHGIEFAAQLLGFDKYIPPFATARDQDILMGVNYGSGGAGIRDGSGTELVIISLLLWKSLQDYQFYGL